jgi:hypothetical protein
VTASIIRIDSEAVLTNVLESLRKKIERLEALSSPRARVYRARYLRVKERVDKKEKECLKKRRGLG